MSASDQITAEVMKRFALKGEQAAIFTARLKEALERPEALAEIQGKAFADRDAGLAGATLLAVAGVRRSLAGMDPIGAQGLTAPGPEAHRLVDDPELVEVKARIDSLRAAGRGDLADRLAAGLDTATSTSAATRDRMSSVAPAATDAGGQP